MHRFFVLRQAAPSAAGIAAGSAPTSDKPWAVGTELELSASDAAHAARVLRLRPGQSVLVCDGLGFDYEAELVSVSPNNVRVRLLAAAPSAAEPRLFLTLAQGVAKGSKMDLIIQKAVEIGVSRIIPVDTDRTVVRLGGSKADARVERWRRIAYEAAKQAGRGRIPSVEAVRPWPELWRRDDLGFVLVPWEAEDGRALLDAVQGAGNIESACIVIGPEGGLSSAEIKRAEQYGARIVTMGPRILRTETASIVACALVLGAAGELG